MLKFWHRSSTLFYHFICGLNSLHFNLYTKLSILYTLCSATALAVAGDEVAVCGDFP